MKQQWYWIIGVTIIAAIGFSFGSAETSATFGWVFLASAFMWFIGGVIFSGRRVRKMRRLTNGLVSIKDEALKDHHIVVSIMIALMLVGVVAIEISVRKMGGLWGNPWLLFLHLTLVAGMIILFVCARFFYTGLTNPRRHRIFAYGFGICFAATLVTGTILLGQGFTTLGIIPFTQAGVK